MKRRVLLPLAAVSSVVALTTVCAVPAAMAAPPRCTPPVRSHGDRGVVQTVIAVFSHVEPQYRAALVAAGQNDGYWSLRHEPGTLSYHVVPDPADPTRFVFVGTFTDAAAYAAHTASAPARAFFALAAKDGVDGPQLIVNGVSVPNTDGVHRAHSRGDSGEVVTVVAVFDNVQPQYRAPVLAAGQYDGYWSLRHEPGTLSYHVIPDPTDPTRFVFEATFANAAAYAAHFANPPARAFFALAAQDHINGPQVVVNGTSVPNVPSD